MKGGNFFKLVRRKVGGLVYVQQRKQPLEQPREISQKIKILMITQATQGRI